MIRWWSWRAGAENQRGDFRTRADKGPVRRVGTESGARPRRDEKEEEKRREEKRGEERDAARAGWRIMQARILAARLNICRQVARLWTCFVA